MTGPNLDISYLSLRKSIGWIGILLPWVARAWAHSHDDLKGLMSISAYYYTDGRDIFVGSLFAAGLFLAFYRGILNDLQDRILAIVWGIAAILIGLIPMTPCGDPNLTCADPDLKTYHFIPVAAFFAINIYMTLFRFTITLPGFVTKQKEHRNTVYRVCGAVMFVAILAIAYLDYAKKSIFLPEAIAVAAFGVAWLVKGQMFLAEKDTVSD